MTNVKEDYLRNYDENMRQFAGEIQFSKYNMLFSSKFEPNDHELLSKQ